MAHITKDRVKQTTSTTGTGAYSFDAAVPTGFEDFFTAIGDTNTCYYCATAGDEWEVGIGTVSALTLTRSVLRSSNADVLINWGAGTKEVFVVAPADVLGMLRISGTSQSIVITGGGNTITLAPATGSTIQGGLTVTGATALPAGTTIGGTGVVLSTRQVLAGAGISGGGDLSADRTISLDVAHVRNVDHSTVSITAGAGLTGGGTLEATRTLDVGAGSGISVAADSVAVDATVIRTTGAQSIAGVKTFTDRPIVPTPTAATEAANKAYVDSAVGTVYAGYIDGTGAGAAGTFNTAAAAWTVARSAQGQYTVTHNLGLALVTNVAVVANARLGAGATDDRYTLITQETVNSFRVLVSDVGSGLVDDDFYFLAIRLA